MKKLIALILAFVMVFALTACGETKTEAPKTEEPADEVAEEVSEFGETGREDGHV